MRKLLIVAILASAALGGAAACASGTPAASASSPSGGSSASAADETKDVCTQAIALEKTDGATVLSKIQGYFASVAAGQNADSTQLLADLAKIQQDWVTAYNTYMTKPIKPEVKTALQNFVTFVQGLSNQSNNQTLPQVTATFNQLDQALTAACGS